MSYETKGNILYIYPSYVCVGTLLDEIEICKQRCGRYDFPSSMVFITEPTLYLLCKNSFYVIAYDKDSHECYESVIRAMEYKRKGGLVLR
jgi:hypothetical protein